MRRDPGTPHVVVTAKLGVSPTWNPPAPARPAASRFLEEVVTHHPGVEVVARARLTLERDPYLLDHCFRGTHLLPTVFGLEARAQAVALATGAPDLEEVLIEDVRLPLPIVIPPEGGAVIELRALAGETDPVSGLRSVTASIRTAQTGFGQDHFTATFLLGGHSAPPRVPLPEARPGLPVAPLYGPVLFHGPRFQRIREVLQLDTGDGFPRSCRLGSVLDASAGNHLGTYGEAVATPFILGDPYFRDALLQSIQLLETPDLCLPLGIARIQRFRTPMAERGMALIHATDAGPGDPLGPSVVQGLTPAGEVFEVMTGYRLHVVERGAAMPTRAALLEPGPRDEEILAAGLRRHADYFGLPEPLALLAPAPGLHALQKGDRHRWEAALIAQRRPTLQERLGTSPGIWLEWRADGSPVLRDLQEAPAISITHDDRHCLCLLGGAPLGVDLEPLDPGRSRETWQDLLGPAGAASMEGLLPLGDDAARAGARLWCAREAVWKASAVRTPDLEVVEARGEGILFRCPAGDEVLAVLTFPVQLSRGGPSMVAFALKEPALWTT